MMNYDASRLLISLGHPPNPLTQAKGERFLAALGMTWGYARNNNQHAANYAQGLDL